jgi:uncharacterized protein YcfL
MNNLKIFIVFLLISLFTASGCSSSQKDNNAEKNLTGKIEVVGNEPFTHLAVRVGTEKTYILQCDSTSKNLLEQNQGKRVKIFYKSIDKSKKPNIIVVERAELIKNNQN